MDVMLSLLALLNRSTTHARLCLTLPSLIDLLHSYADGIGAKPFTTFLAEMVYRLFVSLKHSQEKMVL